jgi:predicted nucleic-acid-binding protein
MAGLDTNVLVRYLAQDHVIQARQATQVIERQLTEERPGFISLVTIVETAWVLDRVYGLSNREVAAAVERILQADTLLVQNEQEVFTADDRSQDRNGIVLGCPHWRAR